ncbi:family 43 glycosylhydrolase [Streptomyces sp. SPB78]|uniref:family 43 glycosylhydrolase n=1 Tax=Streptomyces sp. (strain SPB78) TaxID=591157 RepID=UPI0001B54467|nr:family 43 glycosylhydrolase [Streptomyces sp. SPB78]
MQRRPALLRPHLLLAVLAALLLGALPPAGRAHAAEAGVRHGAAPATYTNPVSGQAVDTFPDPAMIRGKDGYWYAYGTQNPVFQSKGETGERMLPILRSADLTHWTYAGEVFTPADQPAWHGGSRLWAPDIRYTDGQYTLYYSVPDRNTVGVATAPTPTGPWTDRGAVLPSPSGCASGNIDQAQFTDVGGQPYLYWGSYDTICVARLNGDRTRVEGQVTEVAQGRRVEGGFVVRREGWYYLFYSDAGCCDGGASGYQVKVGRSQSPTGPFSDDQGVPLMAASSKGTVVVGGDGRWIGAGHNALQTDLSGQDWLVYHAIPAADPDLARVPGIDRTLSRRPLLIDRLDWIDGWPVVRAGAGPSHDAQPAPVTAWDTGSTFASGGLDGWQARGADTGAWALGSDRDAGGLVSRTGAGREAGYLVSPGTAPARVRAEADLRVTAAGGSAGLVLAHQDAGDQIVAWLDRPTNSLVTDVLVNGRSAGRRSTPLPSGFQWGAWRNVAAELRGTRLTVEVSADRLHDAVATQTRTVPDSAVRAGHVGIAARGAGAQADNVGGVRLYTPVTERVPDPRTGPQLSLYGDEFDGPAPNSGWSWVRGPATGAGTSGGDFVLPTQNAELNLGTNTASVLNRPAPSGDFVVETKLSIANGPGNQQAGLVLYGGDDRYVKLVHAVLPVSHKDGQVTHVTEFAREGALPAARPPAANAYGPMFGGAPGATVWLRLARHVDTARDLHEVRAAISTDGTHWTWTGTWTLPDASAPLRIGLVALNTAGATARFGYVRTYAG